MITLDDDRSCAMNQAATSPEATSITLAETTSVSAERVLAAASDFSSRRARIFPAVSVKHMTVHALDSTAADVTEGTRVGPLVVWERCDYDWSQPGRVTATVTDSNVYGVPGSRWEITARPVEDGSLVEMTWTRCFRRSPLGRFMGVVYRRFGQRSFAKYARDIVQNLEQLDAETHEAAPTTPHGSRSHR
jgi:hypothetical protein